MAFPDDRDRELQQAAFDTESFADDLLDWMGRHAGTRRQSGIGVISADEEFQLLALRRKAGSMLRSSRVPVAAAVYGPSQVGKSLFVGRVLQPQDPQFSPLGRDENAPPPAYYPQLSFDLDLNPRCGSQEATAIVSRFTTKDRFDEEARKLKDFAVLVRGLSRSEWIRVLARGFRSECDIPGKEWSWRESELEDLFIKTSSRAPGTEVSREWRMDLLDVFSYLKRLDPLRYQADEAFFNGLLSRYALNDAGYVEIAANLSWANWPELTAFYRRIQEFLDRIRKDGREGMLVHWAAVRFLLDSQQKSEHESPESKCFTKVSWSDIVDKYVDGWYVLDYQPGKGPPREQLTTIQSAMLEMVVPVLPDRLNAEWRDVLAEIDFLDIPGMKASGRGEEGAINKSAESEEAQQSIVKRGKVFYLFERYIEELQAQTLLMLIRGGNLNVRGFLKEYVDKWGRAQYGKEIWPKLVQDRPPSLFIGMTGIDEEFEKDHPTSGLYEARLKEIVHNTFKEVMTEFGGQTFTNVYPLRYPGTWDNDAVRRAQLGGEDKWVKAGQAFLGSAMVQKHVAEPARKWEAAMRDGDGGASLLAEAFRIVTSAKRKQGELGRSLEEASQQLENLARSWAVDPNINLDRERRMSLAKEVLTWVTKEPELVFRRVRALEQSLSFQGGDVLPIADFADMNPPERHNPLPIEKRLPAALQAFLRDWSTQKAPNRWHDYTKDHRDAGKWLDPDVVAALTRYMVDYLTSEAVFERLNQRVLQIVSLRVANQADRRMARRKFVRLILNDYVMNPGDAQTAEAPQAQDSQATVPIVEGSAKPSPAAGEQTHGLMAAFVHRWQSRLPAVLAAGAGNKVNIPSGNDELVEILNVLK